MRLPAGMQAEKCSVIAGAALLDACLPVAHQVNLTSRLISQVLLQAQYTGTLPLAPEFRDPKWSP